MKQDQNRREVTIDLRDIERAPGPFDDPIAAQAFPTYSGLVSVTYWSNEPHAYHVESGPFLDVFASVLEDMAAKLASGFAKHQAEDAPQMDRDDWSNHIFEVMDERMLESAMQVAEADDPGDVAWIRIELFLGNPAVFQVLEVGRWEPRQVSVHKA